MIKLLTVLLTLQCVCMTVSAEIYTYKDKNGRLVITDVPGKGAGAITTGKTRKKNVKRSHSSVSDDTGGNREIDELVTRYSTKYDIHKRLIHAIIKTESDYDADAVSKKGAMGLMQLMPETGKQYGVMDFFDPEENISAGTRHFRKLLDKYSGDIELSLAAYNAGETAVEKYNGIPPYRETENYVTKIMRLYRGENYSKASSSGRKKSSSIYKYYDTNGNLVLSNIYPSNAKGSIEKIQ